MAYEDFSMEQYLTDMAAQYMQEQAATQTPIIESGSIESSWTPQSEDAYRREMQALEASLAPTLDRTPTLGNDYRQEMQDLERSIDPSYQSGERAPMALEGARILQTRPDGSVIKRYDAPGTGTIINQDTGNVLEISEPVMLGGRQQRVDPVADFNETYKMKHKAFMEEKDYDRKQELLIDMKQGLTQAVSDRSQALENEFRNKYGVDTLENALQYSIQQDIKNRVGSSPETIAIQKQLDSIEKGYMDNYTRALKFDPIMQAIGKQAAYLDPLDKKVMMEAEKQNQKKEILQSMSPADIMQEAVKGNRLATSMAVEQEVAKTGKSKEIVEKELLDLRKIATDPPTFLQRYQEQLETLATTKEEKALIPGQLKVMQEMVKGSKEKWDAMLPTRIEVANNVMKTRNTAMIQGNVESWYNTTDPAANATMLEIKQKSGNRPVSLSEFSQAYVHEAPTKELAVQRSEEMKAYLDKEIQRINKGSFGNINPTAIYGAIAPRSVGLSEVVAGMARGLANQTAFGSVYNLGRQTGLLPEQIMPKNSGQVLSQGLGNSWESLKQTLANIGR